MTQCMQDIRNYVKSFIYMVVYKCERHLSSRGFRDNESHAHFVGVPFTKQSVTDS